MTRFPVVILAFLLLLGTRAGAQERVEPAAKDATVFGYKLHYLEAGRGEPIILLHGTGGGGGPRGAASHGGAGHFPLLSVGHICVLGVPAPPPALSHSRV